MEARRGALKCIAGHAVTIPSLPGLRVPPHGATTKGRRDVQGWVNDGGRSLVGHLEREVDRGAVEAFVAVSPE